MSRSKTSLRRGLLLLIALGLGWIGLRVFGPTKDLPPESEFLYDDFGFSAPYAFEGLAPGPNRESAIDVTVRIVNYAKRVDFDFDPASVTVRGIDEAVFRPAAENVRQTAHLAAGETAERKLRFIGPPGTGQIRVYFSYGWSVGAILDDLFYGKKAILLGVGHK